ncbi:dihydrofolate reductase family protein [Taklimakanibacter deserti]|uniref:dihydrofolate reductase family protein n=1 Tax=Taklimakanibacter deserti TaxID=2267839 RepID=UPI000E6547D8
MRKIVASAFVSLDGVMQAPGGPDEDPTGGFKYGGWTAPYWDDALSAVMDELLSAPFDLLLGRKTYDIFAAYWPHVKTEGADELTGKITRLFNGATKYVATHSPDTLGWHNSQSLGRDVVATLRDLKQKDGPALLVQGSSNFVQTLLAHQLIDEVTLLTFPVALGKGKRFFGDGTKPGALKLTKSTVSGSGVLVARYEPDGDVKTGSFAADDPSAAEIERRNDLT